MIKNRKVLKSKRKADCLEPDEEGKVEPTKKEEEFKEQKRKKDAARQRAYREKVKRKQSVTKKLLEGGATKLQTTELLANEETQIQSTSHCEINKFSAINLTQDKARVSKAEDEFKEQKRKKDAARQRAYREKIKRKQTSTKKLLEDAETTLQITKLLSNEEIAIQSTSRCEINNFSNFNLPKRRLKRLKEEEETMETSTVEVDTSENINVPIVQNLENEVLNISNSEIDTSENINVPIVQNSENIGKFPFLSDVVNYTNVNIDSSNNFVLENPEELGQSQYLKLNCQQKSVVDMILEAVLLNKPSSCFYIDGPGGSTILFPHGKTLHKTFGMPVPLFSDSVSNFKSQSKDAEYLKQVDVFIWDEAPMAPRYALDLIDRTLRDLMNVDLPFGGKVMVLGGDFRQLLPVKIHATRSEMVNLSIKFSSLWKNFSLHTLTKNMRTLSEETEFAKFLLSVGDGILNDKDNNLLLPEKCVASKSDDIVRTIFGSLIAERKYGNLSKVAILEARNIDVEEINCRVVELLDKNTEEIYTSVDSVKNCDNGEINDGLLPEYLNTLNPPNFPSYELRLRVNCIVMLVRNLSINEGLCNGTRLQVLELANNLLRCKILTGDKAGNIVFIHRIDLYYGNLYPFTFK
ncbi:ATP-dependent DNA helicase pfh1-like [Leptopilina heterotoma]|uniref:ATP-dependent DNA helicase pfh1-like n=1 Tax=Leptopilina heterotoma TaxID=63436 RepID=UPI001CA947BA|nr:ATP-dependent DNA helicase pfh1-like [Leptopilina heterotoma]